MDYHKAAQAAAALFSGADGGFDTATRLHHLVGGGPLSNVLVEDWCLREQLNQPWRLEISVLALRVGLDLRHRQAPQSHGAVPRKRLAVPLPHPG